ncbi:MAG TPA: hypothetical protein VIL37_00950 [Natronosporangium sp.]
MQRSALLFLMAEAREVANVELTAAGLDLKAGPRRKLEELRLIAVSKRGARLYLELTDAGFDWCKEQLTVAPPKRMGHGGAAAYALLAAIRRHLVRSGTSLTAFVARDEQPAQPAQPAQPDQPALVPEPAPVVAGSPAAVPVGMAPGDVQELIRKAYHRLATRPGDWVKLSKLRPLLGGIDRATIDQALVALYPARDVSIEPQSDQKTLTDADWAAAVYIGNEAKHVIAIGQS